MNATHALNPLHDARTAPAASRPAAGRNPARGGKLAAAFETLALWRRRSASRRQLAAVGEAMLRDIGVSRADAQREINKWFWQA